MFTNILLDTPHLGSETDERVEATTYQKDGLEQIGSPRLKDQPSVPSMNTVDGS